jgi:hypothetical protein
VRHPPGATQYEVVGFGVTKSYFEYQRTIGGSVSVQYGSVSKASAVDRELRPPPAIMVWTTTAVMVSTAAAVMVSTAAAVMVSTAAGVIIVSTAGVTHARNLLGGTLRSLPGVVLGRLAERTDLHALARTPRRRVRAEPKSGRGRDCAVITRANARKNGAPCKRNMGSFL